MPSNSPEYAKAYYKRKRREVIELLGNRYQKCGTISNLEIDHVNGYKGKLSPNKSRGGARNLSDARKLIKAGRKNELRLLCHQCNKAERKRTGDNNHFKSTSDYTNGLRQRATDLWFSNLAGSFFFENIDVETGASK